MYNNSMDCRYSKNQEHDKKICEVFWGGGGGVLLRDMHIWAKKWQMGRSNKQHINEQWEVNLISDRSPGRF